MTDNANIDVDISRVFDAPRALVYRAFTDPDQLAQWYGPVGFSVPRDTVDIDARVGGHLRLVMVSDTDPEMRSVVNLRVTEVVENELLVGTEDWKGVPGQQGTWSIHRRRAPAAAAPRPAGAGRPVLCRAVRRVPAPPLPATDAAAAQGHLAATAGRRRQPPCRRGG